MSDTEGATKKGGYRLEYANSARAKCKGTKPCLGTPIPKGTLRVGSVVDIKGHTNFAWRHWGCTTPKIIANMKAKFSDPDDLDGFEDLNKEDQDRVRHAWEEGHVADEDIPPTARKPVDTANGEDDVEKPKKKRAPAKKKAEAEGDEEEKPKKKRATKPKKIDEDAEDEDTEEVIKAAPVKKSRAKKHEGEEEGEKSKGTSRRQPAPKKSAAKKKAAKNESEASGEDFGEELGEIDDDEDEDADESAGKKRKRPASTKQAAGAKKSKGGSSRAKKSKAVVEEDEDDE
ncbi:hypothetical protein JVU11DRAFT_6440 [Chiua virens]|nr:hypothetical protein JVU11DRAFT_6440 [Chiua virens]